MNSLVYVLAGLILGTWSRHLIRNIEYRSDADVIARTCVLLCYPFAMKLLMDWIVSPTPCGLFFGPPCESNTVIYFWNPTLLDGFSCILYWYYLLTTPLFMFYSERKCSRMEDPFDTSSSHATYLNYFILVKPVSPITNFMILITSFHVPIEWIFPSLVCMGLSTMFDLNFCGAIVVSFLISIFYSQLKFEYQMTMFGKKFANTK